MICRTLGRDITKLPKWAQRHIADLEARVKRAESTLPWAEPGMDWFTINGPCKGDGPRSLFVLNKDSAHPICSLNDEDRLFIGRARSEE